MYAPCCAFARGAYIRTLQVVEPAQTWPNSGSRAIFQLFSSSSHPLQSRQSVSSRRGHVRLRQHTPPLVPAPLCHFFPCTPARIQNEMQAAPLLSFTSGALMTEGACMDSSLPQSSGDVAEGSACAQHHFIIRRGGGCSANTRKGPQDQHVGPVGKSKWMDL